MIHKRQICLLVSLIWLVVGCRSPDPLVQTAHHPIAIGSMVVRDNYLYSGGLKIYDINDPLRPQLVGVYNTGAYKAALHNSYAFLATGGSSFEIVDISDLSQPVFVDRPVISYAARNVVIEDAIAYFVDGGPYIDGIRIFDISDIQNLVELSQIAEEGREFTPTVESPIAVKDYYLYLFERRDGDLKDQFIFHIFDVSNPASPRRIGSLPDVDWPIDLVIDGDRAYVVGLSIGLTIIDISQPSRPVRLAFYSDPGGLGGSVVLDGQYVYLSNGYTIKVLDFTDLNNPKLVAQTELRRVNNMLIHQSYLYAPSDGELYIFETIK